MSDSQRSSGREGRDGGSRDAAADKDGSRSRDRPRSAPQQQQEQRPRSPPRSRGGDRRRPPSPGRHLPPSPRHHRDPPREQQQQQQQQRRPDWDDRPQRRGPPSPRGPPPPPHGFPRHPRDRDAPRDGRMAGYRDGFPWDSRDRDRGPGPYHFREPPRDDRDPRRDYWDRDRDRDWDRDRDRDGGGYGGLPAAGSRPFADGWRGGAGGGGGVPPPPRPRERSSSRERGGGPPPQRQQAVHGANAAAAAAAGAGAGAAGGGLEVGGAFALLERFLSRHEALRATVAPTFANVNTVHVLRTDTITFIGVQQWLAAHLGLELQLLAGTYVVVPAHDIPLLGDGGDAERSAIPLRVRQVAAVELAAGVTQLPESVLVLLEGGGEVAADRLSEAELKDIDGHKELCCELASLQCEQMMPLLTLHQLAHTVWRLQLCADLERMISDFTKEQQSWQELGLDADMQRNAAANSYSMMRARIQQLPQATFITEVLAYVEQQPGGPEGLKQQLEAMDAAWQQYRQDMLAGRPPQPLQLPQPQPVLGSLDAAATAPAAAPAMGESLGNLQQPELHMQQQQRQPPLGYGSLGFDAGGGGLALGLGFDEDYMFDDPTGLGGLSPLEPVARPIAAPVVQSQGSLGFGMAASGLGGPRFQGGPGVGSFQLPAQQQQRRQFNSGPPSGGYTGGRAAAAAAGMMQQQQQHPDLQAFMTKYNSSSDRGVGRSGSGVPDAAASGGGGSGGGTGPTTDYSYWIQQGDITAAQADPRTRRAQGLMMQTTASVAAAAGGRVPGTGGFSQVPGFAQGMVPPGGQTLNPAGSGSGFGWEGPPAGSFALPPGLGSGGGLNSQQQQQEQQQQQHGSRVSVLDRLGPAGIGDRQEQQGQQDDCPRSSRHESPQAARSSKRGRSPEPSLKHRRDSSRERGSRDDTRRDREKQRGAAAGRGANPEPQKEKKRDGRRKEQEKDKEKERASSRERKRQHRSRSRSRGRSPARAPGSSSRRASSTDISSSRPKDSKAGRERSRERDKATPAAAAADRDSKRDKAAAASAGGSGSSKDKGRSKGDDNSKPPPPEVADILQRLLPKVPASVTAATRAASPDRNRDRERHRSRSAEHRSSKRSRGSPDPARADEGSSRPIADSPRSAAAAAGVGQRASPAARIDVEVARRRFAGRLEGADELFGQLSAEAVTREWIHRFDQLLRRQRSSSVKLGHLRDALPIPEEVLSHWGGIFAFLAQHPALTWQPTAKLVGLREGIDLDALPMLPLQAYPPQQQREQQPREAFGRRGEEPGSGPGGFRGDNSGGSRFGFGKRDDDGPGPRWGRDGPLSPREQQQQQRGRFEGAPGGFPGSVRGRSRSPGRPNSAAAAGRPAAAAAAAIPALQLSPEDQAGRELYEQVLAFATSLRRQLADAPEHSMELADVYALLPLQLRSKVAPGAPIDMQKFLEDNIGGVEVVRREGRMLVMGLPPGVNRERLPPRTCAYWDTSAWMGCFKEARCNFRHALGPSDKDLKMWI